MHERSGPGPVQALVGRLMPKPAASVIGLGGEDETRPALNTTKGVRDQVAPRAVCWQLSERLLGCYCCATRCLDFKCAVGDICLCNANRLRQFARAPYRNFNLQAFTGWTHDFSRPTDLRLTGAARDAKW